MWSVWRMRGLSNHTRLCADAARKEREQPVEARCTRGWTKWRTLWPRLSMIATGTLALIWLLLRTGTKPSRLGYPCQQAALGTAAASVGLPVAAAIAGRSARLIAGMRAFAVVALVGAVLVLGFGLAGIASLVAPGSVTGVAPPPGYSPQIYLVNDARGIEAGRYGGVDDLVTLMGARGFKWHRSASASITAGPNGLIDADDVVILKINGQWAQRGGTNTDVLRGVIRRIVEHPDGFVGEIIVADNGQGRGNMDRQENNAEDRSQSPQDVVDDFAGDGWRVATQRWDDIGAAAVAEYRTGDMNSGYVVSAEWDPDTHVKVSYPKFQSAFGTYISYKYGIWSRLSHSYDADKLVVINMPVLKTHQIYAVTAAVKNHMGVVTQSIYTDSHDGVGRGGLGSVLAEVRLPDLTILDCIWILADPLGGPAASYSAATWRGQLVAGTDPIALDVWAAKFIMIPQMIENGYGYDDYGSRQDPDNPAGKFRQYIDNTMSEMRNAGIETTNDYNAVRLHVWAGDWDRDGDLDLGDFSTFGTCMTGPGGSLDPACATFDADADGALDLGDVAEFQKSFTDSF